MKLWVPLINLIKEEGLKKVAEIGVHKGATVRNILNSCSDILDEYWAIDPYVPYEQMKADWDELYKNICSDMIKYQKLKAMRLTSAEAARLFPEQYFDLVFIDADHSYDAIKEDIYLWKPLIRKGGILAGHDYKKGGKFPFWGVQVAVDEIFAQEEIETLPCRIFAVRI